MSTEIVILRDGQMSKRLRIDVHADGTLWGGSTQMTRREGGPVRLGDNGGGLVVRLAEEWDREQDQLRADKVHRLAELFPGLDALRAARDGEEANRESLSRAIESESGASTYRKPYAGPSAAEVAAQHPAAARYLRAEDYSCAHNDCKASAGRRAMERMEAGESPELVAREMEAEWSAAAARAVENS